MLKLKSNTKKNSKRLRDHTVHLSTHPQYPKRSQVSQVKWSKKDLGYAPVNFTHSVVLENDESIKKGGWADPQIWTYDLQKQITKRKSNSIKHNGKVIMKDFVNVFGFKELRPRNPIGRTGMIGRGLLGKYGTNFAADPLVTRYDPDTGHLQMVVIKRKDTGEWAMPGGMVDPGEKVSITAKREFMEEAQNLESTKLTQESASIKEKLDHLFSRGTLVYEGYVDDPRNTDWAWMETACYHFHIKDPELQRLKLNAGDDASHAKWVDITDSLNLYASHKKMVMDALKISKLPLMI